MTVCSDSTQPLRSRPFRFALALLGVLLLLAASGRASGGEPTVYMLWLDGTYPVNANIAQGNGPVLTAGVFLSADPVDGVSGYQLSLRFDMNGVDELDVDPEGYVASPPEGWTELGSPTCIESWTGSCPGLTEGEVAPIAALDFSGEAAFHGEDLLIATLEFGWHPPEIMDGVDVEVGFFNAGDGVWTASLQPTSPDFFGLTLDPIGLEEETGPCSDDNHCTTDRCSGGQCVHEPRDCDDDNPLTYDVCEGWLGCGHAYDDGDGDCTAWFWFAAPGEEWELPLPAGTACDDGDACTTNDVCSGYQCGGTPIPGCGQSLPVPAASPRAIVSLWMLIAGCGAVLAGRYARRDG